MNDNINNNISLNVVGGKPRSLVEQKRLQWARERGILFFILLLFFYM